MASRGLGLYNEEGKNVDMYIPRKCSATNRIIAPDDHAAVQINIADVTPHGTFAGTCKTFALSHSSGQVRARGRGDIELNRLCLENKIMKPIK